MLKRNYLEKDESQRKMFKYDFYRGWYLPSNGTIEIWECCTPWHWPKFSRSNFSSGYFDEETPENFITNAISYESGISHRMAPLLYVMILTCISKSRIFEMWTSRKMWELEKKFRYNFYSGWYFPSNGTISIVVLRNFDLNLQGHKYEPLVFRKRESYRINAS